MFSFFKKLFKGFDPDIIETEETSAVEQGGFDYDALWEDVTSKLKSDVTTRISIPKGRAYFYIASQPHKNVFTYVGGYSVRGKFASFGIEAYCGEDGRDAIQAMIDTAPKGHIVRETEAKQGTRNKTKWTWAVATSIDVPREELVKWYVDVIVDIYSFLEAQKTLQAEMFESDEAVALKAGEPQEACKAETEARNYDKYAINGTGNYGKARMVEAVVNTYVKNNPSITIEALQEVFPHHLLKGYGVIRTEDGTIKDYKRFYKSQLPNGTVFYICNQWGKENTEIFVQYVNANVAGVEISNADDRTDAVVTAAATKVAVEKAQAEAEKAEAERMKAEAEKMRAEAVVAAAAAEKAAAEKAKAAAEKAQAEAMKKAQAEAEAAKKELEALKKAQAEAEAAKKEAERMKAEAEKMRAEAEKARLEAEKAAAEKAKAEAEKVSAEACKASVTTTSGSYDVVLKSAGTQVLAVVKAVKESFGLGLKEAKDLVDAAPSVLKEGLTLAVAKSLKKTIEESGAEVEIKLRGNGALPGEFTINDKGGKICFSQGNLQFNPAKYEFRFAEKQYDIIGKDNEKIAPGYDGWIDLFGWGTSGFMGCQPTEVSDKECDYGPSTGGIAGTNYDWGVYNPITNGGNKEGLWRTPTKDEWEYLIVKRPNASKLKVKCTVCGAEGLMLMPDDFWNNRLRFPLDITAENYSVNTYNAELWAQLEELGVVFMPVAGYRYKREYDIGDRYRLGGNCRFDIGDCSFCTGYKHIGNAVRLVKDIK